MRDREKLGLKAILALLPPLLWMAFLYVLSGIPGDPEPDDRGLGRVLSLPPPSLQNLLHMPAYGALAWLWCRGLALLDLPHHRVYLSALALTLAYAGFDEWHQSFVPGRFPSVTDLLMDALGAAAAVLLFRHRHPGWALQ